MLRRGGWLLGTLAVVCALLAPAAGTTPDANVFRAAISGSQQTAVTKTSSSTDANGCTTQTSAVERQALAFTSTRQASLRVSASRFPTVRFQVGIGASSRSRQETTITPPGCREAAGALERSCGPLRVTGSVTLHSAARAGAFVLDGAADGARCTTSIERSRPFLVRSPGNVDPSTLADPSVRRITVRGNWKVVDRLPSGARMETTVLWTLVLTRAS